MMKKKINRTGNECGVILVTVLMIAIVLSFVAIGIISINVSQTTSGISVVDAIKAEQMATGEFFRQHQFRMEGCPAPCTCGAPCDFNTCSCPQQNMVLDENQKPFNFNVTQTDGTGNFTGLRRLAVTVTYP
jgi:hypothetical protein